MTLGQHITTTHRGAKIHVGTGTPGFIHGNSAAYKFHDVFTIQQEVRDLTFLQCSALQSSTNVISYRGRAWPVPSLEPANEHIGASLKLKCRYFPHGLETITQEVISSISAVVSHQQKPIKLESSAFHRDAINNQPGVVFDEPQVWSTLGYAPDQKSEILDTLVGVRMSIQKPFRSWQ
ncbi:hypothetical protein ABVT39_021831 [Epinephelus coioides]